MMCLGVLHKTGDITCLGVLHAPDDMAKACSMQPLWGFSVKQR
jgi:hypothetical protein